MILHWHFINFIALCVCVCVCVCVCACRSSYKTHTVLQWVVSLKWLISYVTRCWLVSVYLRPLTWWPHHSGSLSLTLPVSPRLIPALLSTHWVRRDLNSSLPWVILCLSLSLSLSLYLYLCLSVCRWARGRRKRLIKFIWYRINMGEGLRPVGFMPRLRLSQFVLLLHACCHSQSAY